MDRRKMILATAGAAVSVTQGFSPALQAQQTQGGPGPQHVADAERAFAATMARRDADAFRSYISNEAIFMASADAPRVLRGQSAAPFSWTPDIVEVLESGTLAPTSGPVLDPKGELIGRFNSIWRLESGGRWRVLFDRGSPVCK